MDKVTKVNSASTEIAAAIVSGDVDKLNKLIADGYAVDSQMCRVNVDNTEYLVTPLFLAIKLGHYDLVPILMSHNANPTVIEMNGDSALSLALKMKAIGSLNCMLSTEGNFSDALVHKNSENLIPLDLIFADVKLTSLLPKIAAKGIRFEYVDSVTMGSMEMVVVEAIEDEAVEMLKSIVELGWDVNRDMNIEEGINASALYYACYCGNYKSVVCLVELGADVMCTDKSGTYALECCLVQTSESYENIACCLIENGFNVDLVLPQWERTVLHAACGQSVAYRRLASVCIRKGADPTIACSNGTLILCNLVQQRESDLILELISSQKKKLGENSTEFRDFINAKQEANGHWPLLLAVSNGDHTIISLLLGNGASPNLLCEDGRSCLHIAALAGDIVACKLLVGAGADVSVRSRDSLPTALDFAINRSHNGVAVFLVLSGADLESKINSAVDAPSSIDLATDSMKLQINEALQAFETFSSLRKLRMMKQVGGDVSKSSGLGSDDSYKKKSVDSDSILIAADKLSSKSGSSRSVDSVASSGKFSRRNSGKFVLAMSEVKAILNMDDKSVCSAEDIESATAFERAMTPDDGASGLSAAKLTLWAERWGSEAAITHVDVVNFLATRLPPGNAEVREATSTAPAMCILCRTKPTNCTLLHAGGSGSGHICVCLECGNILKAESGSCPLCAEPIKGVVQNAVIQDTVRGRYYVDKKVALITADRARTATPRKRLSRSSLFSPSEEFLLSGRRSADEFPDTAEILNSVVVITPRPGSVDHLVIESPQNSSPPQLLPSHSSGGSDIAPGMMTKQDSSGSLFQFCFSDPATLNRIISERRNSNRLQVPKLQSIPQMDSDVETLTPVMKRGESLKTNTSADEVEDLSPTISTGSPKERISGSRPSSSQSNVLQSSVMNDRGDEGTIAIRKVRSPGTSALRPRSATRDQGLSSDSPLAKSRSSTELSESASAKSFTKVKTYSDDNIRSPPTRGSAQSNRASQLLLSDNDGNDSPYHEFEDDDDIEILNLEDNIKPRVAVIEPKTEKKKKSKKKSKSSKASKGVEKTNNRLADVLGVSIEEVARSRALSSEGAVSGNATMSVEEYGISSASACASGDIESGPADYDNFSNGPAEDQSMSSCCVQTFCGCFVLLFVLLFYSVYSVFNPVYRSLSVFFIVLVACNNGGDLDREDDSGCSLGGCVCSLFTFIFGGVAYLLAAFFYCFAVAPLGMLVCLQPESFEKKYRNYKFIDLKNPLKPADKDEFANFQEIDLDQDVELDLDFQNNNIEDFAADDEDEDFESEEGLVEAVYR